MHRIAALSRLFLASTAATSVLLLASCTPIRAPENAAPNGDATPTLATPAPATESARTSISDFELLGVITVPNDTLVFNTLVGGLSAISYAGENTYYFLSDDRAVNGPSRIYRATVDVSDGALDDGDLVWTELIALRDETGELYGRGAIDPEGLVYTGEGFYISTEGDVGAQPPILPAILHFNMAGELLSSLPLPDKYLPLADGSRGVRDNKGFESLTRTPDNPTLISGLENALLQDGPAATVEAQSLSRLLQVELASGAVVSESIYAVDTIPHAPQPANGEADNGLAELVALDNNGTLLALERSYAEGVGNTVRLYLLRTQGATDVSGVDALADGERYTPVSKELLVDFGELGSAQNVAPDNLEGLALGPQLADGRQLLLVASDNNFNPTQSTQLWALAITVHR